MLRHYDSVFGVEGEGIVGVACVEGVLVADQEGADFLDVGGHWCDLVNVCILLVGKSGVLTDEVE